MKGPLARLRIVGTLLIVYGVGLIVSSDKALAAPAYNAVFGIAKPTVWAVAFVVAGIGTVLAPQLLTIAMAGVVTLLFGVAVLASSISGDATFGAWVFPTIVGLSLLHAVSEGINSDRRN